MEQWIFTDDMIVFVENSKQFKEKPWKLIIKFNKISGKGQKK